MVLGVYNTPPPLQPPKMFLSTFLVIGKTLYDEVSSKRIKVRVRSPPKNIFLVSLTEICILGILILDFGIFSRIIGLLRA